MKKAVQNRHSERGEAGFKLLMVLVVLVLIGNAGYQWIPVAYAGENFKQEMQAAILQGMLLPPIAGNPVEVTKKRLQRIAAADSIPPEAYIEVKQTKNALTARVVYTKQIPILPFGIYNYNYHFDQTVTPAGYLTKD